MHQHCMCVTQLFIPKEQTLHFHAGPFFLCLQQSNETTDQVLQTKLKQLARQALDRYARHERLRP